MIISWGFLIHCQHIVIYGLSNGDLEFDLVTLNGQNLGHGISKLYSGQTVIVGFRGPLQKYIVIYECDRERSKTRYSNRNVKVYNRYTLIIVRSSCSNDNIYKVIYHEYRLSLW